MPIINKILLAPTTAAANSATIDISITQNFAHVIVPGLVGVEEAVIQIWDESAQDFVDHFSDGVKGLLNATQTTIDIVGFGQWRISKGVTVSPVSVQVNFGRW